MNLRRLMKEGEGSCRTPINTVTPQIDAGTVYSPDEEYLQTTLREPGSCRLRTTEGSFLPLSAPEQSSPNATHRVFWLAGDLRVNEHAVLTSMHTIWVRFNNQSQLRSTHATQPWAAGWRQHENLQGTQHSSLQCLCQASIRKAEHQRLQMLDSSRAVVLPLHMHAVPCPCITCARKNAYP